MIPTKTKKNEVDSPCSTVPWQVSQIRSDWTVKHHDARSSSTVKDQGDQGVTQNIKTDDSWNTNNGSHPSRTGRYPKHGRFDPASFPSIIITQSHLVGEATHGRASEGGQRLILQELKHLSNKKSCGLPSANKPPLPDRNPYPGKFTLPSIELFGLSGYSRIRRRSRRGFSSQQEIRQRLWKMRKNG